MAAINVCFTLASPAFLDDLSDLLDAKLQLHSQSSQLRGLYHSVEENQALRSMSLRRVITTFDKSCKHDVGRAILSPLTEQKSRLFA